MKIIIIFYSVVPFAILKHSLFICLFTHLIFLYQTLNEGFSDNLDFIVFIFMCYNFEFFFQLLLNFLLNKEKENDIKSKWSKKRQILTSNLHLYFSAKQIKKRSFTNGAFYHPVKTSTLDLKRIEDMTNIFMNDLEKDNSLINFTDNTDLNIFYSYLQKKGAFFELGRNKAPLVAKKSRVNSLDIGEILKQIELNEFEIHFSWNNQNEFTILDFDLWKINDIEIRKHFFKSIWRFSLDFDLTLLLSPNKGLHLYFDRDKNLPTPLDKTIDRTLKCLINHVDILTNNTYIGVDKKRILLHLSTEWKKELPNVIKKVMPIYFYPLHSDRKIEKEILKRLPADINTCVRKGYRRRSFLELIRYTNIDNDSICIISDYFCLPSKCYDELESEVFEKRPLFIDITLQQSTILVEKDIKNLENVAYDSLNKVFLIWDDINWLWTVTSFDNILIKLKEDISFDLIYKNRNLLAILIKNTRDIQKIKTAEKDIFIWILNNEKICFKINNNVLEYFEFTDKNEYKNLYIYRNFDYNIDNIIEKKNSCYKLIEKIKSDTKDTDYIMAVKSHCPQIFQYISNKFKFNSLDLKFGLTTVFFNFLFLLIIKNFPSYQHLSLQKYFLIQGLGGSGKSELASMLHSFVDSYLIFDGELGDLGGRFETSFMMNKQLLSFADERLDFSSSRQAKKESVLKKLTGGTDKIRAEEKFEKVFSFNNTGLVVITINERENLTKPTFIADNRRRLLMPITNPIRAENQDSSVLKKILQEEYLHLIVLALKFKDKSQNILDFLKNWNTDIQIVKAQEYKTIESLVDPFTAFLESSVKIENTNNTFISWKHFGCLFLQYLFFRKYSKINILNTTEFLNALRDYMANENCNLTSKILENFLSTFDLGLVRHQKNIPILEQYTNMLECEFQNRLVFLSEKMHFNTYTNWSSFIPNNGEKSQLIRSKVTGFSGLMLKKNYKDFLDPLFKDYIGELTILINNKNVEHIIKKWSIETDNQKNVTKKIGKNEYIRKNEKGKRQFCTYLNSDWFAQLKTEKNEFDSFLSVFKKNHIKIENILESTHFFNFDKLEETFDAILEKREKCKDERSIQESLESMDLENLKIRWNSKDLVLNFPHLPIKYNALFINLVLECLYYQNTTNNILNKPHTLLHINPLIQHLYNILNENEDILFEYKKIKTDFINNNEGLTAAEKRNNLKKLNEKPECLFFIDFLVDLKSSEFQLIQVPIWDKILKARRTYHTFKLLDQQKYNNILNSITILTKKPMSVKPLDWILTPELNLISGGYLLNEKTNIPIYHNLDLLLQCKIEYNESFLKKINTIQKLPFFLDEELFKMTLKKWLEFYKKELLDLMQKFKDEYIVTDYINIKSWDKYLYVSLVRIKNMVNKINNFILELLVFKVFTLFNSFQNNGLLHLYYPIHLDRIGRMYNFGMFNIVNSKFMRQVIKSDREQCEPDIELKTLINEKIEILEKKGDLNETLLKLQYYKNLLTQKGSIVFLDATASMLQIYSILFADIHIAKITNLGEESYDPYIEIRKKWEGWEEESRIFQEWKFITDDRETLKKVIMLSLYGASHERIYGEIMEIYGESTFLVFKKDLKGFFNNINWMIKCVKKTFPFLFEFHKYITNKSDLKKIHLIWQMNKSHYSYFKTKKLTLDITKLMLENTEEVMVENVDYEQMLKENLKDKILPLSRKRLSLETTDYTITDKRKNGRTILTGIIHSLDAEIALNLRYTCLKKYGRKVYSIHDCFACDSDFAHQLKIEYKKVLFDALWEKKLSDIIYVDDLNLESNVIDEMILERKKDEIWNKIKNVYSQFCLKLE